MNSLAIETHGLGKRFGARAALESIDLEVPRGSAFGFLGRNGAGKTTLVRLLLGLAQPTSGTMRLLGHDLPGGRAAALARVGAIVEEPRFHPHLTGRENLHVHAAARDRAAHARVDGALERVGLKARADDPVKSYSLGMRQRLGIARCLLCDPELLILDEPVNGLDPAGILEFRNLVRSLVAEGRTVLLSSHLLDEVEKTCDFAAIVDQGRVMAQGTIDELVAMGDERTIDIVADPPVKAAGVLAGVPSVLRAVEHDGGIRATIEPSAPRDLDVVTILLRRLLAEGISVERVTPVRRTLEDQFLSMTTRLGSERVMFRLIEADVLKLRRRRGMVATVAGILFGAVAIYYGVGAILDKSTDFDSAVGILALLASVAGAIFGATAGGQDIETGVFRDLVATGRSRTALFFARVPAAWALALSMLAVAVLAAAIVSRPSVGDIGRGGAQVLISGGLTAAIAVGLAALTGRSGPVMGLVLTFQLGVAPLLAQLEVLGDARLAIPAVAISRLDGADGLVASLPLLGAIAIILAWAAAALSAGLYRTRTQEI